MSGKEIIEDLKMDINFQLDCIAAANVIPRKMFPRNIQNSVGYDKQLNCDTAGTDGNAPAKSKVRKTIICELFGLCMKT